MTDTPADEVTRLLPQPGSDTGGPQRDLTVMGASAGGVQALAEVVAGLPLEFPGAVLVALHVLPTGTSVLPQILERAGRLPAATAKHGEHLEQGRIYVAPPDYHLLVWEGRIQLSRGPRENGHRPAIDPMFRSAARTYGQRVIGVVLSGTLDDGTAGMRAIKESGGTTIAQDPRDALYSGMPQSAIDHGTADHVIPAGAIADRMCDLVGAPLPARAETGAHASAGPPPEITLSLADSRNPREGHATGLTCPDCGGTLWAHEEGDLLRFRCHVGHAYSTESMQSEQSRVLESALWSALRGLEEQADLFRRVARRSPGSSTARRFEQRAAEASHHADAIKNTILTLGRPTAENGSEVEIS
jgi:two-component system chemotaxis response regulator CheB